MIRGRYGNYRNFLENYNFYENDVGYTLKDVLKYGRSCQKREIPDPKHDSQRKRDVTSLATGIFWG